ncbi:MAG: MFS transporter [Chloroflexi bacterium]|nr:MFS transporter [Chloroflexota bacterium]
MTDTGLARPARGVFRRDGASPVFYGWWIVAAGVGLQALQAGLLSQAYGAYVVLLRDQFGWSKTLLSGAYSMAQAESGITGPVQGWLTDRFGPRAVLRTGVVIFAAGFMLFSQVNSVLTFYLFFFVMAVGMSLGGYMSITVAIVNWFQRRRATALGMTAVGVAIGGLMVPGVTLALEAWGWRTTAFFSGVIILVLGLPLAQVMRARPEDHGLTVDGAPPVDASARGSQATTITADYTLAEAIRTRQFWLIAGGHGAALLVVGAVTVHLVSHLHDNLGYSLGAASLVVTVLTFAQVGGGIAGGWLGDRFSKRAITASCMFVHAGALLMVANATATWMVLVFAVAHGMAWGIRGPLMAAIRADYFGRSDFGKILGASQPVIMIGLTGGPILAGILADRTGSYEAGFTVLAVLAALGSTFFIFSTPPRRKLARAS